MANINHTSLAVSVSMGVTVLIILAGLFALLNSAMSEPAQETGLEMRAPMTMEGTAATGAAVGEAVSTEPTHVACNFKDWVGKPASTAEQTAKDTGRPYRILSPGAAMTMDYRADRINIETDSNSGTAKVTKVTCG